MAATSCSPTDSESYKLAYDSIREVAADWPADRLSSGIKKAMGSLPLDRKKSVYMDGILDGLTDLAIERQK